MFYKFDEKCNTFLLLFWNRQVYIDRVLMSFRTVIWFGILHLFVPGQQKPVLPITEREFTDKNLDYTATVITFSLVLYSSQMIYCIHSLGILALKLHTSLEVLLIMNGIYFQVNIFSSRFATFLKIHWYRKFSRSKYFPSQGKWLPITDVVLLIVMTFLQISKQIISGQASKGFSFYR